MKQRKHIKEKTIVILITIFLFISVLPIFTASDSSDEFYPGCIFENEKIICASSGELSSGHYVFAGGSACCGCTIRHNGSLPTDFPETTVESVIFYLTTSRNNSYYTTIENGPNDLKLILGDQEALATSTKLPTTLYDPVQHSWYLQFNFNPPVSVTEGTPWELIDGDNNIYSAVWLHASDVNQSGLPGMYENSNCQYAETRNHWYSVEFISTSEDTDNDIIIPEINITAINHPIIEGTGGIVSAQVTSNTAMDLTIKVNFYYENTNKLLDAYEKPMSFTGLGSQNIDFTLQHSLNDGIPIRVEWDATYNVSNILYHVYYTDYIITMCNPLNNDTKGYFLIYDSIEDTSSYFNWNNIPQEYKETAYISDDGSLRMLMVNYTIHHSPVSINLEPGKKLSEINGSKLMEAKGHADTFVGVADEADVIGTTTKSATQLQALGVVSAGVDFSYITYQAIKCRESGEGCPKDDWERFDMLASYALASATLVGAGFVAVGVVVSAPALVTAGGTIVTVAGTIGLAYSVGKMVGGLMLDALDDINLSTTGDNTTRVIEHKSIFMQTDPNEYDFSTGLCSITGMCSDSETEVFVDDVQKEIIEEFSDADTEGKNCTGVTTVPLSNYVSGNPEGSLHLVELTDEDTGEQIVYPLFIEQEQNLYPIAWDAPFGDDVSYDFNYDAANYQGTIGTPNNVNTQGTTTYISQNNQQDLDLHIFSNGKHVGVNYETGEVENQIPGAWYSGDTNTGHWSELIILPETIQDYEIVIEGRDAHESNEQYEVITRCVKDGGIQDEARELETILKGSQNSYEVSIVDIGGDLSLDTVIGERTTPNGEDTPGFLFVGLILFILLVCLLNRRRK